jgi:hypothetical protein
MSFKPIKPKAEEKFEFEEFNFDYNTVFDLPEMPELDQFGAAPEIDVEPFELPPMDLDLPPIECDFDF